MLVCSISPEVIDFFLTWKSRTYDEDRPPQLDDLDALSNRSADQPIPIPENFPCTALRLQKHRFTDTPVYPTLETNIDASIMKFSQEPIPEIRSEKSIKQYGLDTPFRHHSVISKYIEGLVSRNGYGDLVEFNTTVERAKRNNTAPPDGGRRWTVTLRQHSPSRQDDFWWQEEFDAVVVASGHYSVPYVPHIKGLKEFAATYPGDVEHTKGFRDPERYRDKVCLPSVTLSLVIPLFMLTDKSEL